MKTRLIVTLLPALALLAGCKTVPPPPKLDRAAQVVWVGIDYADVRMYGTTDFNDPEAIFPGMLNTWNALFVKEMIPDLESRVGKPVAVNTDGMYERNQRASKDQIIRTDGPPDRLINESHITRADIQNAVRNYDLSPQHGIGLVFVADRLVKLAEQGAVYTVFFDMQTREVLFAQRNTYAVGGFGFRNYWFSPMKRAVDDLPNVIEAWSASVGAGAPR